MREKELTRQYEADINERFGGKQLLTVAEVAEFLGRDKRTVRDHFKRMGKLQKMGRTAGISVAVLASYLS